MFISIKNFPYFIYFFFQRIIATPGRFMHLCIEMDLKLHDVKYVVFDEADRYV